MKKIKILGVIVLLLSILLVFISEYISEQNKINNDLLKIINEHKSLSQEISKNIFYMYRAKNTDTTNLDLLIQDFMKLMAERYNDLYALESNLIKKQEHKIVNLWNTFYLDIQKFKNLNKYEILYRNLLLEKTVNNIYKTSLSLMAEFDKLLLSHQKHFQETLHFYKIVQYILFFLLIILSVYLFSQVKAIIEFIQKFKIATKKIITNSSVLKVSPIQMKNTNHEIKDVADNFNFLLNKINDSIIDSQSSMKQTTSLLEQVELNIEEFLMVLNELDDNSIDVNIAKKEDAIIQSLEELITLS